MILLVENECALADVYFALLTLDGYNVSVARNGLDALKQIRWQRPELIIVSDWRMPGIDGIELCRRVRHTPTSCTIPILLMGGSWPGFNKDAPFDAFVQKPFPVETLLDNVRALTSALAFDERR